MAWTEDLLASIPKGTRGEEIRVTRDTSPSGKGFIGIRLWYDDEAASEMRPTKKGISIPEDLALQVVDAIYAALEGGE